MPSNAPSLDALRADLTRAETAVTRAAMIDNVARRDRELAPAVAYRDRLKAPIARIEEAL